MINSSLPGTKTAWPYLLLLNAVPALISLAILPFLPESPRYLFLIKRDEEAARKCKPYPDILMHLDILGPSYVDLASRQN